MAQLRFLALAAGLILSASVHSSDVQNQIIRGMVPDTITIIGEDHRRPESIRFFKSIISEYLQQDKCLVVTLEIASSQQAAIDNLSSG